jgi:hypothetical protein
MVVIASDIRQLEHIEYTPAQIFMKAWVTRANIAESRIMQNIYVVLEKMQATSDTE